MVKNKLTADARQMALNIRASNEKLPGLPIILVQNDRIIACKSLGVKPFKRGWRIKVMKIYC